MITSAYSLLRLGLLPDVLDSDETAYFRCVLFCNYAYLGAMFEHRSTNMPRTIETLQQVLYGLYPESKISKGFVPRVRAR